MLHEIHVTTRDEVLAALGGRVYNGQYLKASSELRYLKNSDKPVPVLVVIGHMDTTKDDVAMLLSVGDYVPFLDGSGFSVRSGSEEYRHKILYGRWPNDEIDIVAMLKNHGAVDITEFLYLIRIHAIGKSTRNIHKERADGGLLFGGLHPQDRVYISSAALHIDMIASEAIVTITYQLSVTDPRTGRIVQFADDDVLYYPLPDFITNPLAR